MQKELMMANLDEFELDILNSVENGEWESKGNLAKRTQELQSIVKHQKKKAISIRISENDLYELKRKFYPLSKFNTNANTPVYD